MPSDTDIYESLGSALLALGAPTRDLVISALESKGILFRPQAVDIKSVDQILIELFGVGSNAIIDLACHRLDSRLLIGFDESQISDPVEKIRIWLEVNGNRGNKVA
ncbi:MAG: hypothetical protein ACRD99_03880 [Nitrososphaera sp.]